MNKSDQNRLEKIISISMLIIAVITLLVSLINFFLTPYLTYEEASYPLPAGESLYVVIVRNEGHKSADDVEIYINTKGQIENAMGQRGLINKKIEECQLFKEYVSLSSKKSYFKANLSYLPCGMEYRLYLIVSEQKNDKYSERRLITHRDGIAVKRKQNCFIPFCIGLGIGSLIVIFFYILQIKKFYNVK